MLKERVLTLTLFPVFDSLYSNQISVGVCLQFACFQSARERFYGARATYSTKKVKLVKTQTRLSI